MCREYKGLREAGKGNSTKTPRDKIRIWEEGRTGVITGNAMVITYTSAEKGIIQTLGDTKNLRSQTRVWAERMDQHGQGRVLKRLREDEDRNQGGTI